VNAGRWVAVERMTLKRRIQAVQFVHLKGLYKPQQIQKKHT